jgi:hypothetical protein
MRGFQRRSRGVLSATVIRPPDGESRFREGRVWAISSLRESARCLGNGVGRTRVQGFGWDG